MSAGSLVAQGSLAELRRSGGAARVRVRTPDGAAAAAELARLGLDPQPAGDAVLARFDGAAGDAAPGPAPETIVAALVAAGVRVRGFALEEPTLEERFVALTGEGFDVAQ
jgi:ABC-2 type transport system ATP-binding protein